MQKRIIKLLSCLIPSSQKRRRFRNKYIPKKLYHNNKVIVIENGIERELEKNFFPGIDINFEGNNNIVKLYPPPNFAQLFYKYL